MPGPPKLLIGTPWNISFVSTGFCVALRNLYVPFPYHFVAMASRHVPDARNAICDRARSNGFSHILMLDADTQPPQDTVTRLWNILEACGHDNTVAAGWARLKTGPWANKPSVFKAKDGGGFESIENLTECREFVSAYAVGSACLLFSTKVLDRISPPWFADIFVVIEGEEFIEGEENTVYCPTEYRQGQDLVFSSRIREAGVKLIVDPKLQLPHEVLGTI